VPEGWHWIEPEPGIRFAVPPDAQRAPGTAIDSTAGVFDGAGYRVTFDLGRFGERLESLRAEPDFRSGARDIAGRSGREAAFGPTDEPFAWARVVQVGIDSQRTPTVRVSCDSIDRCALADRVFDSIAIDS
jgi:hypothetical protein